MRQRVPGDGPRCWCGRPAVFSGHCSEHTTEDGELVDPSPIERAKVAQLARCLVGRDRSRYEALRTKLIAESGYDRFRAMQSLAFELALYGDSRELNR